MNIGNLQTRKIMILFLLWWATAFAHTPSPCSKENKFLITTPLFSLYGECSKDSPFVSQGIYGHSAYLIHECENGWALLETEDGYRGYGTMEGLVPDDPRWRTSAHLSQVRSLSACIYPIATTISPTLLRIPFGSMVELFEEFESNQDRWLQVRLADGATGWIQRGDVERPRARTVEEMLELASMFLGRPYIWGGSSSEGFDCSGFVQAMYRTTGVLLPRDSRPQAASEKVYPLDHPEQPGDLVFFGEENVNHVGIYLGDGFFIHSGVLNHLPKVAISSLTDTEYRYLDSRRVRSLEYEATILSITEEIQAKMTYSWREDNPVPLADLRYIQLNHWGFDGCVHDGELVVHQAVAEEVVDIFAELFAAKYPIEKMLLMDAYQADDDLACEDNNSSCFCSRPITGSSTQWSLHSYGLAIDINTLLNPYHRGTKVVPVNGEPFLDRSLHCRGMIKEHDPCYQAFISRGWKWGGHWPEERGYVDYQHFYKDIL